MATFLPTRPRQAIGLPPPGECRFAERLRELLEDKHGVGVLAAYFTFETKDRQSFINERLLAAANYAVDIDALGSSKEHKQDFATLFRKA